MYLSWQMKNSDDKKVEGNIVVFEDLGIYSRDPEVDRRINENLKKFLISKGYKIPRIKIKPEN